MKNYIPEEIVEDIKRAADIVDVISATITLKKSGANLKGVCPVCDSSSFTVTPSKELFKCFGCGWGGKGAINFLMKDKHKTVGMTYPEALRWIADRNGISIN